MRNRDTSAENSIAWVSACEDVFGNSTNARLNVRIARRPLTDLRWFLGLVSAGEPRQHGMADSLYERMLSTRRVHRLAAILLRRWQAEEIAKTPLPYVSRILTKHNVQVDQFENILGDRLSKTGCNAPARRI